MFEASLKKSLKLGDFIRKLISVYIKSLEAPYNLMFPLKMLEPVIKKYLSVKNA